MECDIVIPVCLFAIIIFVCSSFLFQSLKGIMSMWGIALMIGMFIPCYFLYNQDKIEQCRVQKNQERINYDKQFLLNSLDKGQCGEVCIKESDSKHSNKYHLYTMCEVSIKVCKDWKVLKDERIWRILVEHWQHSWYYYQYRN